MSGEFITLTRQDPEFNSYLLGTFSSELRALPVETYHASTQRERVTFRVIPVTQSQAPAWWRIYLKSCRPDLAPLTLGPALVTWFGHSSSVAAWTQVSSWCALLGIFFLHTATFLFNDVQDHLQGADRLNRRRGSQVIQKGWVSAASMRSWAWLNFALATAFGVPAFLMAPMPLLLVCGLAALALLVILRGWATRWGLCDLAIFFLLGPLLTVGTALASFGEWQIQDILVGMAFGSTALWFFQMRQIENLFRAKPQDFRTAIGFLNFEAARWTCIVEGCLLLVLQPTLAVVAGVPWLLFISLPLVSAPSVVLITKLYRSASPLSSALVGSSRWALLVQLAWATWWLLASGVAWL